MSPVSETRMTAKKGKHGFLKAHVVLRQRRLEFLFRDACQGARRPEDPRGKKGTED